MKSNRRTNLLLGLAGLCLSAGLLRGADVTGSFTLPHQTRWGTAVLPAGNYTLTMDHANASPLIIHVRQGTKNIAMVRADGASITGFSGDSTLRILESRVRSLRLAPTGFTYHFVQPKNERQQVLARTARPPETAVALLTK